MYTTLLWNDAWFEAFLWKFVCGRIAEVWKWPQTLQTWAQWKQFLYWKSNSSSKKEFFIYKRRKKDGTTRCYALFESDVYSGKSNRTIALSVSVQLKMADSMDRIVIFVVFARIYRTLQDSVRFYESLQDSVRFREILHHFWRLSQTLPYSQKFLSLVSVSLNNRCHHHRSSSHSRISGVNPSDKRWSQSANKTRRMAIVTKSWLTRKILVCVPNWHFK